MELLQRVLDQLNPSGEADSAWLKEILSFVSEQLKPLLSGPAPSAADDLLTGVCVCLVKKIQESTPLTHTLPVSYRLLSVSELLSQQHLSCVSNLSWSTNQQRAWAKEAELSVPGHRALPRVSLLLIGCLTEGRGEWRLTDASGSIRCECLSPSPLWLDRPVFLPHWNYIPQDAAGQEEAGGYLELIGSPHLLSPGPEPRLADGPDGGAGLRAVGVREAAGLLQDRARGRRVSVFGQVGSVCPLLVVAGTAFLVLWLTDGSAGLPVLVKEPGLLWWAGCVCVGQSVCVTALRVCVLRGWRGNNILCVTDRSEIHTNYTHTHAGSAPDTPPPLMSQAADSCEEAEPERDDVQSAVRMKQSRVISYQGTVTEVVSEGAGLYMIDRKVGLCLAYQPALKRKLRAGDTVELHHVHFLYRPCPDLPPSMLCTCLRSSLRVTTFSRVAPSLPDRRCPGDSVLPRLLLEKNVGVSEYLWTCHLSSQLSHSLVPSVLKQQCVCVLSWRLMECVWRRGQGQGRRDIYSEMLDEPHTCPLTQYHVDPAVPQGLSVSELCASLLSQWSSVSLSSLLSPGGRSLTASQINAALSWSCRTLTSDPAAGAGLRPRPLLLVGVLELPAAACGALRLRDGTGAIDCVVTESREEEEGGQRAAFNTAWIGCLVCVQQFTMVTERFLQSDFPSYQHLEQDQYITHTHCRVYLQFSLDHVHVLSPSVAMETHLQRGGRPGGKRRREEAGPASSSVTVTTRCQHCVSVVIRVEEKEGVIWVNTGAELQEEGAGLEQCFSLRAAVIGPVVVWGRDPKNQPMADREAGPEEQAQQVVLLLPGVAARWFPVLQNGCFYRLIAPNTQDPSVLIGCGVSGRSGVERHTDSTLQVRSDWRFHTLTRPLLLHTCTQVPSSSVLSVSEVLDGSSQLVCFQAQVLDRVSLNDRTSECAAGVCAGVCAGVRLTVCDRTGRRLQVYLDLSHAPYPPGLLPGNTLLLSAFQRRVSRSGGVYCSNLPVSSVCVVSLEDVSLAPPPPAPMMHLGDWALCEQRCIVGRVRGHVVCFLFLQLQWSCSQCGSVFSQNCSSSQCRSTSSIFQSEAKLVMDDGTGEAHVWFSGVLVRPLLGLADSQWEGLQRALRVRGHVRVHPRGQSLVCDSADPLLDFLLCVCGGDAVCRQLRLTCRKLNTCSSEEMKRFSRGEQEFMSRVTPPLQLTCLHLD